MVSTTGGPVWVAGGSGLVGSAVVRLLAGSGRDVVSTSSNDLDLRDRSATAKHVEALAPSAVVVCAARVGGISANTSSPVAMLSDNAQMGTSVLDACAQQRVPRVVVVGSAAMYPAEAPQPISEDSLWRGPAAPAHEAYAAAKLLSLAHVRAIRKELGLPYVMVVPTNIYGPHDNFHAEDSHVVPGMLRKFWEAARTGAPSVSLWGSGKQRREFVHADDLASAVRLLLDQDYADAMPLNVGAGEDVSIAELAEKIAVATGFDGELRWQLDKPEGPSRRVIDSTRLRDLGWEPTVGLDEGLRSVHDWLTVSLPAGRVRGWSPA